MSAAFAGGPLKKSKTPSETTYHPQTGDVVFQSLPHNPVIDAIEGCTASPYSHCGIVVKNDTGWLVLEAVGPVKETPLRNWVLQGRKWEFSVCRLKPAYQPKIEAMVSAAREFKGRPYDIQYEFDDAKIYCSELIFKAFRKAAGEPLGATCKLGDLNWMPHQRVIRQITGGTLPLDREMITPRELALAKQLTLLLPFGNHLIE
ncbi:MAG: hypothetical protein K1X78_10060 [Verrucomicrobiaceae bacterium]|nr:hypothetical protein [Verrucomicrobiaceae bacterium]